MVRATRKVLNRSEHARSSGFTSKSYGMIQEQITCNTSLGITQISQAVS